MSAQDLAKQFGGSILGSQPTPPMANSQTANNYQPPQSSNPSDLASSLGGQSLSGNSQKKGKGFVRGVADFFIGNTQAAGKDLGEAVASPANVKLYNESIQQHTDITTHLLKAIKAKEALGQDPSSLQVALQQHNNELPKLTDFTGDTINKSNEQILGDFAGAALEATSGGLLETGAKNAVAKELSTGQKILQNSKIGGAYGAVGGAVNAMQNNQSAGNVALGAVEGGVGGGALGGTLGLLGAGASGLASKLGEYATNEGLTKKLGDTYNTILNLTPKQQTLEDKFGKNAGEHMATLANEGTTLPIGHQNGNLNTNKAQTILTEKLIQPENQLSDKLIASEQKTIPWNDFRTSALKTADQYSGSDRQNAMNKINKELTAYEKQYKGKMINMADGGKGINLEDINQMRKDFWSKAKPAFNSTNDEKLQANIFNKLGHVARQTLLENTTNGLTQDLLSRLGDHQHLLQILKERNNKPIGMSTIKQYISKFGLGAIGDMIAGHGGGVIGYWSGARLAHLLDNPNLDTAFLRTLLKKQGIKDPAIIKNVEEMLNHREQLMQNRPQLPAPSFMEAPAKTPPPSTVQVTNGELPLGQGRSAEPVVNNVGKTLGVAAAVGLGAAGINQADASYYGEGQPTKEENAMNQATNKAEKKYGIKFPKGFLQAVFDQESSQKIIDPKNLRLAMGLTDKAKESLGKEYLPDTSIENVMQNAANYLSKRSTFVKPDGTKIDLTKPENLVKWYVQRYVGLLPQGSRMINGQKVTYEQIAESFKNKLSQYGLNS